MTALLALLALLSGPTHAAMDFELADNDMATVAVLDAAQNQTGMTLCAWMNIESWAATTFGYVIHISNGLSAVSGRVSLAVGAAAGSDGIAATARRLDADALSLLETTTSYTAGVWHHACAVFEFSNQILRIYVDGAEESNLAVASWTGATSNTASVGVRLGERSDGAENFDGISDDIRVYRAVLTPNQINTIYQARGRDRIIANLYHRWTLSEFVSGTTASGASSIRDKGTGLGHGSPSASPVYASERATHRTVRR